MFVCVLNTVGIDYTDENFIDHINTDTPIPRTTYIQVLVLKGSLRIPHTTQPKAL